jgi:hypothetical protein
VDPVGKALIARIKEVIHTLEALMGVGIVEGMVVVVITNRRMRISRGDEVLLMGRLWEES